MKASLIKALAQASEDALSEAMGAATKFPSNTHMHAALAEEVGELAQALLEHHRGSGVSAADVYAEAMQVAAMAMRIAVEGSAEFAYCYEEASSKAFRPTGANKKSMAKASGTKVETNIHVHQPLKAVRTSEEQAWIRSLIEAGVVADPTPDERERHLRDAAEEFRRRLAEESERAAKHRAISPNPWASIGGGSLVVTAEQGKQYSLQNAAADPQIDMPGLGVSLPTSELAALGCFGEGFGVDDDSHTRMLKPQETPKAKPLPPIEVAIDQDKAAHIAEMTPYSKLAIINRLTAETGVTECGLPMYGSEGKVGLDYQRGPTINGGSPAQQVLDRATMSPMVNHHGCDALPDPVEAGRIQSILDRGVMAPTDDLEMSSGCISERAFDDEARPDDSTDDGWSDRRIETRPFRADPFDRANHPTIHCNRFG